MRAMLLSKISGVRPAGRPCCRVADATTYSFPGYGTIKAEFPAEGIGSVRETAVTVDREEIGRFAAQAQAWWDPQGNFRPLHRLNPARLYFIRQHLLAHFGRNSSSLRPFDGLTLLDIGCGGGLIAEPMAR